MDTLNLVVLENLFLLPRQSVHLFKRIINTQEDIRTVGHFHVRAGLAVSLLIHVFVFVSDVFFLVPAFPCCFDHSDNVCLYGHHI